MGDPGVSLDRGFVGVWRGVGEDGGVDGLGLVPDPIQYTQIETGSGDQKPSLNNHPTLTPPLYPL